MVRSSANDQKYRGTGAGRNTEDKDRLPMSVLVFVCRVFCPALDDRIGLKVLQTRTFGSGVIHLRCEIVRPAG